MADQSPLSLWRRFLALPVDSRPKTLLVAFAVSAICALLVSGATVLLRPIQQANRAAEQQMRLDTLLAAIPGMDDILAQAGGGNLSAVVVDLASGQAAPGITPATVETALAQPENWTPLSPEQDMAQIRNRPNYAQIFLLRDSNSNAIRLAILPVFGAGYNGSIEAMLALRGDMNTIAGMTVTRHAETPGLGARIDEATWQAGFAGKQVAGPDGAIRFDVARGAAASDYAVDGITGATRTSTAIGRIVRFWMGPNGYGPLIAAIRRGEF